MLARIEELAALKENWDGYGAPPMLANTLKNADALLRALTYRYPDVAVTPTSSGTILFEWNWDGAQFDLEVGETLISGCVDRK